MGLSNFIEKVTNKIASMDISSMSFISSEVELKNYVIKLYIDQLLSKLNLNREYINDENYKKSLCTYVIRNLMEKDYKYHAFNSAFFDSVLSNGINPNVNFTSEQEINIINSIFEKNGIKMIFGWKKLNCERKVSYSKKPSVSYYYGINSPEWFAQFTGQGFPFNSSEKYKKDAYIFGDYDSAKNNLITLMNEYNFSNNDKESVINFFEKNWKIYAHKTPMLAIISDKQTDYSKYWIDELLNDLYYKDDIEKIMDFCINFGEVDCQTTKKIDVTNAKFIKMPRYDEIIRKLSSKKEENIQDNDKLLHKKLMTLANAKIKVKNGTSGQSGWTSDNGEQELLKVKEILKDNDVFQAIVKNKYGEQFYLDGWIRYFDKNIINIPENIKLLAVNKPYYFNCISEKNRNNIELMREVASQNGIHPIVTCYVGTSIQNDFEFISNLIINSNEKTFDFYGRSAESLNGSNMRYGKSIGIDVRCNPFFWQLLNSKIISINENATKKILLFSAEKELIFARQNKDASLENIPENNLETTHRKH